MWIKEAGTITERIEFLGHPELCSYLVKGDTYALLGGAMAHVIPDVLTQLNNLKVDLERIKHRSPWYGPISCTRVAVA